MHCLRIPLCTVCESAETGSVDCVIGCTVLRAPSHKEDVFLSIAKLSVTLHVLHSCFQTLCKFVSLLLSDELFDVAIS